MGWSNILTLVLMAYLLLHLATLLLVLPTAGKAPAPWDVVRAVQECVGAVLRKVRKKTTYRLGMNSLEVLGLDVHSSYVSDAHAARARILAEMHSQPWTYPLSQRDALKWHADRAEWQLTSRDILEKARQTEMHWRQESERLQEMQREAEAQWQHDLERLRQEEIRWQKEAEELLQRQSHERARRRQAASTSISAWRQTLGLAPDERDISVIKQAYRKRAQVAHPDRGGSHEAMSKLNQAMERARAELSFV